MATPPSIPGRAGGPGRGGAATSALSTISPSPSAIPSPSPSPGILRGPRSRFGSSSRRRCRARAAETAAEAAPGSAVGARYGLEDRYWTWRGHRVRYQGAGEGEGRPVLVLIHGFGGNADHWRKNTPAWGEAHRVFALDLLGYGFSDKPDPREGAVNGIYNFYNWAELINDFVDEVVGEREGGLFFVCNSVGSIAGLQAAKDRPGRVAGVVCLNPSLRMLHVDKQPALAKPFIKAFQDFLRTSQVGPLFFGNVATERTVGNILREAYHDPAAVTDELVEVILKPGLTDGAVNVFLDFISYSGGPLPEELLPAMQCPVLIGWGDKDPWEPIAQGRAFAALPTVDEFVELPDVGHVSARGRAERGGRLTHENPVPPGRGPAAREPARRELGEEGAGVAARPRGPSFLLPALILFVHYFPLSRP